ncbi:hypothetical protein DL771_004601 [Monosporascus sp. 5C6A]|nr:hypothetical protein DL771_004601 [Monosporascus sp. 5C6A]
MDSPLQPEDDEQSTFALQVIESLNSILRQDSQASPVMQLKPWTRCIRITARGTTPGHPTSKRLGRRREGAQRPPRKTIELDSWDEYQLWSDLPLFGSEPSVPVRDHAKRCLLNLQTYAARIAGLRLAPLEMYAI